MERTALELEGVLDRHGDFRVHRKGCRDLPREAQGLPIPLPGLHTPEEVALDLWSDIIAEGGMEPEEAEEWVTFLPCCAFKEVAEDSAKNLEEVVDADANSTYTGVVGQEQGTTEGVTMNATTSLVQYTANLQTATTVGLRKMAAQAGIREVNGRRVHAGRKAELIEALTAKKAEELEQAAKKAEAKKAPKKSPKKANETSDDSALKIRTARKFVAKAEEKGWNVKIDNQMATEQGDVVIVTAKKDKESITLRWIDGAYDYYQGGSFHTDANGKARKILNTSAAINRYL